MNAQKSPHARRRSAFQRNSTPHLASCLLAGAMTLLLGLSLAEAQTAQYKRTKKASAADASSSADSASGTNAGGATTPASPSAQGGANPAAGGQNGAAQVNGGKPSDKVDISDLENRYWAPKDSEFNVVQNRQYTKAKRFSLSLEYGPVLNSTYVSGNQIGLTGNYYFSERMGVQVMYDQAQVAPNSLIQGFITQNQASPNYNIMKNYYGVGFNWIPFYAKMSVLEQKIVYFDMAITPNIGVTDYQQQVLDNSGSTIGAFTYGIDISQHFFLSRTFAIRWDLLNRFYTENVVTYKNNGTSSISNPGNQNAQVTTLLLGLQIFFN